jgi:hypothetical protein
MKVLTAHKYAGCPTEIPDELLDEKWAIKIHSQDLKELNRRGGLAPNEIYGNIQKLEGSQISKLNMDKCAVWLEQFIKHAIPTKEEDCWDEVERESIEFAKVDNKVRVSEYVTDIFNYLRNNYNLIKK